MNDDDRLRAKLEKLSDSKPSAVKKGRELQVSGSGGWLVTILDELDETILARKLSFENDAGKTVELEVANRRLHAISRLSGGIEELADSDLMKQVLSDADDGLLQGIGTVLKALVTGTKAMWVNSLPLGREIDPAELGVSVQTLGKAWSLDHYRAPAIPPAEMMQKLLNTCAKNAGAVVQIEDATVVAKSGAGAGVERLLEYAAQDRSTLRTKLDRCFKGKPASVGMVVGCDRKCPETIVLAFAGNHEILLLVPTEQVQDVFQAWNSTSNA